MACQIAGGGWYVYCCSLHYISGVDGRNQTDGLGYHDNE